MIKTVISSDECKSALKRLYRSFGYKQYKMSRFEEYELYVRNKDFLQGDKLITFNDSHGHLLALKPDVTLSIVKNAADGGELTRVYYSENVYRAPRGSLDIREIPQIGLECLGKIDAYLTFETVALAARSLEVIDGEYVLDVSHMGYITAILDHINADVGTRRELLELMSRKNPHDIMSLCSSRAIPEQYGEKLGELASLSGKLSEDTIADLSRIADGIPGCADAIAELSELSSMLLSEGIGEHVNIDFSVVNDMNYYNGIVFLGFVKRVPASILSGGRYDNLPKKLSKSCQAIGFAIDLGLLEQYSPIVRECDADVLLTYSEGDDPCEVARRAEKLRRDGFSVYTVRGDGKNIRTKLRAEV